MFQYCTVKFYKNPLSPTYIKNLSKGVNLFINPN